MGPEQAQGIKHPKLFKKKHRELYFRTPGFLTNRDVFDNAVIALRIRGMLDSEIQERVAEILKMVNLRYKATVFRGRFRRRTAERSYMQLSESRQSFLLMSRQATLTRHCGRNYACLKILTQGELLLLSLHITGNFTGIQGGECSGLTTAIWSERDRIMYLFIFVQTCPPKLMA